jgi:hypothetical protein
MLGCEEAYDRAKRPYIHRRVLRHLHHELRSRPHWCPNLRARRRPLRIRGITAAKVAKLNRGKPIVGIVLQVHEDVVEFDVFNTISTNEKLEEDCYLCARGSRRGERSVLLERCGTHV